ncbi:C2 family cysteine protease [Calothrix sp. UHCC 0171]|uniref:C2 family cysteine protease n=1 Tax=Calothrix sp. UHCC 0171 TaxID=3110245 RepID=UPI002B1E9A12|nr:C2 family cysteine protease [Calothrix sp. UHCC 0171]MEA5572093.1 C2 family cysteine protease [Calothrix sp. UHCC 0171]
MNNFKQSIDINSSLNISRSQQVLTGSIGWENTNDYYSFNLNNRSSLDVTVDGLSANLNVQILDSNGSIVAGSYNRRKFDESINVVLEAGKYYIEVYRLGRAVSNYNLRFSSQAITETIPSTSVDWFDQVVQIQDAGIRQTAKSSFTDGIIDRNEMIAILRDSKDGGIIDGTEFADLKTILNHAATLSIPEPVRVLANKIINGDAANQKYQGNSLGNLSVGSSDTQMENLINKWFLGGDRPSTAYTYQQASGSLFQNGISYQDITQGQINDCFFLAGLAATAINSVQTIENMFIDNGDNTFTIKFWRNQIADYVTVDRYLPTDSSGNFVYASKGKNYNNSTNELWVALVEKAYAQLNESGWIYQDNTNSYSGIAQGGYIGDALQHITGNKVWMSVPLDFQTIINSINLSESIGFGSKLKPVSANIIAGHAYALVNYNYSTQKFTLFNPWGIDSSSKPGVLELSWSEIESNFSYWDATKQYT